MGPTRTCNRQINNKMKVENVSNGEDVERYIEGCINDFEGGISRKDETIISLAELVAHVYMAAKKGKDKK